MSIRMLGRGLGWLVVGLLLITNLVVGARIYSQELSTVERDDAYARIALFTKALEQVRANYVDADKVTYSNLVYNALRGMVGSLDPHSQFLDEEGYDDLREDTSGQFGGLGIVVGTRDGQLTIIAPMEDTPAFRAGLLAGDRIVEIDGKPCDGVDQGDAVKKLRGEPGSQVTLKIARPSRREFKTFTLTREEIKVSSVKDARVIEDGIAYVRITTFSEPTAESLQRALDHLETNGMKALILDLRNNPGGLLVSAREVAEKFLPRQSLIVSTEGRDGRDASELKARGRIHSTNFPMVVLINGGSASASEIVAGAMQDHKRAVLLGEKSFGKGSVQTVLRMDNGTALRLTTAKYYTPRHRLIHEKGIEPDVVVPMAPDVWRKIYTQRMQPVGAEPDDGEEPDFMPGGLRDLQLERAVDMLRGIMTFTGQTPAISEG